MWESIKKNMPSWVQAIATVVLVWVTITYVGYSGKQVDIQNDLLKKKDVEIGIQKQQLTLVNRAKIFPKFPIQIEGRIDGGAILVENRGNLPAEDFRLEWKVVKIDGGGEEGGGKGELRRKKIRPEEIIEVPYKSNFKDKDEVVVLVAVWKYKGQGIEDYMIKDSSYLWDIYQKPKPNWAFPYKLGYDHIKLINSIKDELRQLLEKEN